MKTVFEAIKEMSKEEFSEFVYSIYNKGWFDGKKNVDDEDWIYNCLADYPMDKLKEMEK